MKSIIALGVFTFGIVTQALDTASCLVWSLKSDNSIITSEQSSKLFEDILLEGKKLGFTAVSTNTIIDGATELTNYTFSYDRESVLSSKKLTKKYEALLTNLDFHLNSRHEYSFSCELLVPEPRPRISGSN